MKKIIVSLLVFVLLGCSAKRESTKDPATNVISSDKIAECEVKVDTTLPQPLDLTNNRFDKLEVQGEKVIMGRTEFLSIQHLLLTLMNRIYELQETVKDSKK